MAGPDRDLAAARLKAAEARLRLMASAHQLQARLAPKRLAHDAVETAKRKGQAALDDAADMARRRPTALAAGAIGMIALLARRRIGRLFRRKPPPREITYDGNSAGRARALPRPKGDGK